MRELRVSAKVEELTRVISFVTGELEAVGCSPRELMQIEIAVEELWVNIACYAYRPEEEGIAWVRCLVTDEPSRITVQFIDEGKPYNPLERPDPDITQDAKDRALGGLGIFMAKKSVDQLEYAYENGRNILTLKKEISGKEK